MLLCSIASLSAQAQLSNRLDAFAGINGTFLQPAANVSTPYSWDLNLVNFGIGFSNDYAFLINASGMSLQSDARGELPAEVFEEEQTWALGSGLYAYDYVNRGKPHFGAVELDVLGPAFSVQIGEWTRVGLFSRVRAVASSREIDADFSYYPYDRLENGSSFKLSEVFAGAAAWAEYGLHLSQAFPMGDEAELQLGINARYLSPFEGAYIFNPGGSTFSKLSVDSVSLEAGVTEMAFTNVVRDAEEFDQPTGSGIGIDFGARVAWEPMREGGYRYSLGLSVIDAGNLNFDQQAERHRFASETQTIINSADYRFVEGQEDVDEVIGVLNDAFYGQRGVSLEANKFTIGLPTAISAQFTYQPISDLRLAAAYVGGVKLNSRQLRTGQQLALAAHFSRWWYGAGLTTNLHDWRYLNIGAQLRLGPITLGTDRFFGTLSKVKRFQAADFYIGVKFHNFGFKKEGDRSSLFRRSRSSREVKCYQF